MPIMLGKDYVDQDCALARALEVIGERWTPLILRDAFYGVRRFSDFQAHLDIPKAVLAERLNGLVEDGLLERIADPHHAGRYQYVLTPIGKDLWPALHALMSWGDRHRATNSRIFKHAACGTAARRRREVPPVRPHPGARGHHHRATPGSPDRPRRPGGGGAAGAAPPARAARYLS